MVLEVTRRRSLSDLLPAPESIPMPEPEPEGSVALVDLTRAEPVIDLREPHERTRRPLRTRARARVRAPRTAPPTTGVTARLGYIPALDGLRAVAVGAVLLFHSEFSWASGGFLGVSTFFTLSGFLITTLLLEQWVGTRGLGLRGFYSRRLRRLMPAALLVLAGIVLFGATVATADQLRSLRGDVWAALAYVANWRFIFSGRSYSAVFSAPSPVEHFWSLAIEEQFYFVFPMLLAVLVRIGRGSRTVLGLALGALAVASTIACALWFRPGDVTRAYYGTDARAAELLIGAVLAVVLVRRPTFSPAVKRVIAVLGVVVLAITVWIWSAATIGTAALYRGGFTVYAIGSVVIILAALQAGPISWLLSRRGLVAVGKVSYGVYLVHWPVFLWLTPERTGLSPWPLLALRLAVTAAITVASYFLLEQPVRRRRMLARSRVAIPVAIAAAAAIAIAVVPVTASAAPDPYALLRQHEDDQAKLLRSTASTTVAPTPPDAVPVVRAVHSPQHVMFVGDSVGAFVGDAMYMGQEQSGLQVADGATYGCGFMDGERQFDTLRLLVGTQYPKRCDAEWLSGTQAFDPDVTIVLLGGVGLGGWTDPSWGGSYKAPCDPEFDQLYTQRLTAGLQALASKGSSVYAVTAPPPAKSWATKNTTAWQGCLNQSTVAAAAASGSQVIDLAGWVAANESRPGDLRHDGMHFIDDAAVRVGDFLMTQAVYRPVLMVPTLAGWQPTPLLTSPTPVGTGGGATLTPPQVVTNLDGTTSVVGATRPWTLGKKPLEN